MQSVSPLAAEPQATRRSSPVLEKLAATQHQLRACRRVRVFTELALVELCLAAILVFADWMWELDTTVRAGGLIALAAVAVLFLVRRLFIPQQALLRPAVAARVESQFPELGQRVRTTLEYLEPTRETAPASHRLVEALRADTDRRTQELDFQRVISWKRVWALLAGLAALVIVTLTLLVGNEELRIAAQRLLLIPVAYSELEVSPGSVTLRPGKEITIHAVVSGRPVAAANLLCRRNGSDDAWTRLALTQSEEEPSSGNGSGLWSTTLQDCQEDFEYRVAAGRMESPSYQVRMLVPLVLEKLEAVIEPPAYAHRQPQKTSEGNFTALEGSRARFQFTLNRSPEVARLVVYSGTEKEAKVQRPVPLQIDESVLTGQLAGLEKDLEYELTAETPDHMRLVSPRFHIRVQPDGKPTIKFVKPEEQIEVTPTTEVEMRVEAADDIGLSKVGIVYQVGNGPKQTIDLKAGAEQPLRVKAEALLALEDQQVNFRDGVTYYAFAEDNYPVHPHRVTTELQFIDIRPYKRSFQLVEGDSGGC
jgi:hypothetical protein